jgi:probable addiction module antidote protein
MTKHKKYEDYLFESLKNPEEAVAYLNAHIEESDELFLLALRDVAMAYGFTEIAKKSSLGRESLYKSLSETGNPKLTTLKALLKSMGLKLSIQIDDDVA